MEGLSPGDYDSTIKTPRLHLPYVTVLQTLATILDSPRSTYASPPTAGKLSSTRQHASLPVRFILREPSYVGMVGSTIRSTCQPSAEDAAGLD